MTDIPNQVQWRKVFQNLASDLKVEAALAALSEIIVKQATAGNLNATVTVAGGSLQRIATASQAQVSVGTNSTTILAANSSRISFLVRNISATDVYVYLGTPATLSNGIILESGASIFGDNYTGIITGIVSSGSATVSYIEV